MIVLFFLLFVLSGLITLMILTSGERKTSFPESELDTGQGASVQRIVEEFSRSEESAGKDSVLTVQDFLLPENPDVGGSGPYLLRQRLERWSEQQVQRYWIPLEDIALDLVVKENDRRIESLFEDIP